MKAAAILICATSLVVVWFCLKMRHSEYYNYSASQLNSNEGAIVARFTPEGEQRSDGIFGHTIVGTPYGCEIWCDHGEQILAVKELRLHDLSESTADLHFTSERAQFHGRRPPLWYYRIKEKMNLRYVDYLVTFSIDMQRGNLPVREILFQAPLKRDYISLWSNDFLDKMASQ